MIGMQQLQARQNEAMQQQSAARTRGSRAGRRIVCGTGVNTAPLSSSRLDNSDDKGQRGREENRL